VIEKERKLTSINQIVDPQTATLTNIEVLSYFTANPPRKSTEAPPGVRNFIPKPDLRDHCTVVTEVNPTIFTMRRATPVIE
jgi:hypothetical protein